MIQLILKKGKISKEDVPLPKVARGTILVKVMYSCISTGTEIAALKATGGSLFRMALEQPGNIAKGLQLIKEKGIFSVAKNIKEKISDGSPVGYSVSGIVLDTGESVKDFTRGERVACAGTGYANHAEYVEVPYNLAAKIPEGLDFAPASTVALGAIALQGIRRAQVELGEYVVVFGLGIIGQISLQLLKNAGCYVIGIDVEEKRLKVAAQNGADLAIDARKDSLEKEVFHFTGGYGADKVLFCASTDSSLALHQAFQLARKNGKIRRVL
ncbi:MAG: zinc-binding alcohol dehydrogenase [Candidatus Omnitrophica bacterium]|nr:zinc-binding alcohol dehydrogenase [Candidatus Omnitrophota bacterium]